MKELFKRFKQLTGIKYTELAEVLGVTKQAVDKSMNNYSITHVNANKWLLTQKIDEAIEDHSKQILELEKLKQEIKEFKVDL
ncbi:hypothetical protein [Cellulosilyticum lentocellum]|uniref:Uncharacterized protein n=1 Tax=Cellulosilyticum lentocellum (strain ATCC 49066 / DSM 5427 / NCIMB 11756 / RHM5) TaxID=642492 RepID=F2JPI7_CELLD|nr:hypothetical protein [Cellulosilyticum lentocellum]ADZ82535.1 hypothetical protein Clole_0802 [Cellulosilyticum lentocellum DSM 5427]